MRPAAWAAENETKAAEVIVWPRTLARRPTRSEHAVVTAADLRRRRGDRAFLGRDSHRRPGGRSLIDDSGVPGWKARGRDKRPSLSGRFQNQLVSPVSVMAMNQTAGAAGCPPAEAGRLSCVLNFRVLVCVFCLPTMDG